MGTLGQYSVHIIRSTVLAYAFRFRKSGLIKQDRQCRYNVTLRRVRATSAAVEKQRVLTKSACICSLSYSACNAHASYCHLWPARLYNIFPHYLINCTIFGKKIPQYKVCVLLFFNMFIWNNCHFESKWAACDKKTYLSKERPTWCHLLYYFVI